MTPISVMARMPPVTLSFASLFEDRSSSRPTRRSSRTSFAKARLLELRSSSANSKTTFAAAATSKIDIKTMFMSVSQSSFDALLIRSASLRT